MAEEGSDVVPRWVAALTSERFFNACISHEESKKNEKNVFCLDCCEGLCPHCLLHHRSHRLLQIRRYVYHNVLKLGDADKLMDCSHVQSYTSNSAKVVFIKERPQPRIHRASDNFCISCDRNLQRSYLYCSLSCKLQHVLRAGCDLSKYFRRCEALALSEDDGRMTPDSALERPGSVRADSGSSAECLALISTATTAEVVRKKRSALTGIRSPIRPVCRPVSDINRRKGRRTPHRSPLY